MTVGPVKIYDTFMILKDVILIAVEILVGLGVFVGGVGYLYRTFSKSGRDEKADVLSSSEQLVDFWKQQVEGFKEVIKELREKLEIQAKEFNEKLQTMGNELGSVRGQLDAESRQKKDYLAILENRDPATKQFMEHMVKAMENQDKILQEIYKFAKVEHERDFKVEATVTKA